jgi:hypothetical protein
MRSSIDKCKLCEQRVVDRKWRVRYHGGGNICRRERHENESYPGPCCAAAARGFRRCGGRKPIHAERAASVPRKRRRSTTPQFVNPSRAAQETDSSKSGHRHHAQDLEKGTQQHAFPRIYYEVAAEGGITRMIASSERGGRGKSVACAHKDLLSDLRRGSRGSAPRGASWSLRGDQGSGVLGDCSPAL